MFSSGCFRDVSGCFRGVSACFWMFRDRFRDVLGMKSLKIKGKSILTKDLNLYLLVLYVFYNVFIFFLKISGFNPQTDQKHRTWTPP